MKPLTRTDLRTIIDHESDPCVSITIPTHVKGQEIKENSIRFKNLVRACQKELNGRYSNLKSEDFLKPCFDLVEDTQFWNFQSEGFALFMSPDFLKIYSLTAKPKEKFYIGKRFYIVDLLPTLMTHDGFYIFALSQKDIKLFEAGADNIKEVPLHNVIKNIDELFKFIDGEKHVQMHSAPSGKTAGSGMVFHGQGNIADDKENKKYIGDFYAKITKEMDDFFYRHRKLVILAGVEYNKSLYRKKSSYANILEKGISYNEGQVTADDLHKRALSIIKPILKKDKEKTIGMYNNAKGSDQNSNKIEEILPAAYNGRVDSLLVDTEQFLEGSFDTENQEVHLDGNSENSEDLVNLSVIYSLKTDAKVYSLESGECEYKNMAVFRY